jgi:hypothetical protein
VLSPLLFSFYVSSMPTLNSNTEILKYADDTVILEFLTSTQPSCLQQEADHLYAWCCEHDLLLNSKKTKELVFSNARDNPTTQQLVINGSPIDQVTEFVYLGTTLTTKLDFTASANRTVKKARTRLHIMSKLYHLGIDTRLITSCYKSFIESILLYHLVVIYSHLSADSKKHLQRVVRSAGRLAGDITFTAVADLYHNKLATKSLRMVATEQTPMLTFTQCPSGRYSTIRYRVNLRKLCFRANCVHYLNSVFSKK